MSLNYIKVKKMKDKKSALILEGGGVRGIFSAGVLDTFIDNNITFDAVVGVSAGALFGVNLLSGQKGRALRYNKKYNKDRRYMGIIPLIREGNIVNTDYAYRRVPYELDPFDNEAYKNSKTKMYAVTTEVETGEPAYLQITDVYEQMDTLRASGSLPIVSKPVMIDGRAYLDGGISDSIPYEWALDQGYDRVVVVLTRDINYRKKPSSKLMADIFLKKYPNIREDMLRRHENYNNKVERLIKLEQEKKVFVIRPSIPLSAGRLERDATKIQATYDCGKADAQREMSAMLEYMQRRKSGRF